MRSRASLTISSVIKIYSVYIDYAASPSGKATDSDSVIT